MRTDPLIVEYDISQLHPYQKKDVLRYCIPSLDIAGVGTQILLSTLEGPVRISAGPETYVMIGPCEDVYPISRQHFDSQYQVIDGTDTPIPAVAQTYGWEIAKIRRCRPKKPCCIYARPVPFAFRVYIEAHGTYICGAPGDYCAAAVDGEGKLSPYIICARVMALTYQRID